MKSRQSLRKKTEEIKKEKSIFDDDYEFDDLVIHEENIPEVKKSKEKNIFSQELDFGDQELDFGDQELDFVDEVFDNLSRDLNGLEFGKKNIIEDELDFVDLDFPKNTEKRILFSDEEDDRLEDFFIN
jgi:hypothetical protein